MVKVQSPQRFKFVPLKNKKKPTTELRRILNPRQLNVHVFYIYIFFYIYFRFSRCSLGCIIFNVNVNCDAVIKLLLLPLVVPLLLVLFLFLLLIVVVGVRLPHGWFVDDAIKCTKTTNKQCNNNLDSDGRWVCTETAPDSDSDWHVASTDFRSVADAHFACTYRHRHRHRHRHPHPHPHPNFQHHHYRRMPMNRCRRHHPSVVRLGESRGGAMSGRLQHQMQCIPGKCRPCCSVCSPTRFACFQL